MNNLIDKKEIKNLETEKVEVTKSANNSSPEKAENTKSDNNSNPEKAENTKSDNNSNLNRKFAKNYKSRRKINNKPKHEYDKKILSVRRVTRVVAGGRRFSFSVALVIGNGQGHVGVGIGKSSDTISAIEKAYNSAKKNLIKVRLTDDKSIKHHVEKKYSSSRVFIQPALARGLIAGGAVRTVLEFCGVNNVNAKILSKSKNSLNNARVTIEILKEFSY